MTPLARVIWGLIVVTVDMRIDGLDLLPDPVGWLLVLTGLMPLSRLDTWFTGAAVVAGCSLAMSLPDLVSPLQGWPGFAYSALHLALLVSICSALLRQLHDPAGRRSAGMIRAFDLTLGCVLLFLALTTGVEETRVSGAASAPVVLGSLASMAVLVWFLVLLAQVRRDPGLQPRAPVAAAFPLE